VTARLSPRRRVLVAVVTVVLLMTAGVAGFAVTRGDRTGGSRAAQDRPGRLLLVPGFGGGTDALDQLAQRLTRGRAKPAPPDTAAGRTSAN
jgi:triacylglycerol lipase